MQTNDKKEIARQNGLKGGRPRKALSMTTEMRNYLVKHPDRLRRIIIALFDLATKRGNIQAIQEIFNRIDGKVIERHELETRLPINLIFSPFPGQAKPRQVEAIEGEYKELTDGQG